MKRLIFILMLLPGLLNAQNLRRWGSTGAISTMHGNWFYNSHPVYGAGDTLKLVDFRLLKDTAAALRSAMGGGSGMSIGGTVTSGTTGSILFVGSSSALNQDNSNFFWDNSNKRLGIGTATPAYRFDVLRAATGQAADSRTLNVSTTGSTFNTTAAARTNNAGYFSADASVSTGSFGLTNIGIMGMATGGDANFGIGTSNSSYTGAGYFYQSANNTTRIQGGPGTDNVAFGPDNRIRLNVGSVIIPSGSLSVGSNSDDGIATLQVYGYQTLYSADSTGSPANMLWLNPSTKKIMLAAVPGAGTAGTWTPTLSADANVDGTPTILHATYTRIGNIVTCYVTVSVDPTVIATQTEVGITLPVASAFTDSNDLSGTGAGSAGNGAAVFVLANANTTSDRATLIFQSGSTSASIVTLTFQYTVL